MTKPDAREAASLLLRQAARAGLDRCAAATRSISAIACSPLDQIALTVAACTRCPLAATRQRTVPGEGAPDARLMLVGEGPGAEEDRTGRPFVGAAGQLLDKILQQGMGLRREDVFIANVLKCRPPGNRDPEPSEAAACSSYLESQIAAVGPELLIALGRHAAQQLTGSSGSLQSLRGRMHKRPGGGPPVLVTFHPAYLLRNPAAKKDCWSDIQQALGFLGLPLPPAQNSGETASGNQVPQGY